MTAKPKLTLLLVVSRPPLYQQLAITGLITTVAFRKKFECSNKE